MDRMRKPGRVSKAALITGSPNGVYGRVFEEKQGLRSLSGLDACNMSLLQGKSVLVCNFSA